MRTWSVFFYLLCFLSLNAQHFPSQEIEVEFDASYEMYTEVTMVKGLTVFGLSKTLGTPVNKILAFNGLSDASALSAGYVLKVPVLWENLFTGTSISGEKSTRFIPVVYRLKPKETLFRVAKVFAEQSVQEVMTRNDLNATDVQIGQALTLGWLPLDSKERISYSALEDHDEESEPVVSSEGESAEKSENEGLFVTDDGFETGDSLSQSLKREKGIAIWSKQSKGHSRYALHPTARLNSEIELFNPIVQRTVTAKVIGRIPEGAYQNDVSIIISPATAVSLGALDTRFKVYMKYTE